MKISGVNEAGPGVHASGRAHGQEVAALAHAKHAAKAKDEREHPAVVVEVGRKHEPAPTYVEQLRKDQGVAEAARGLVAAEDARVHLNLHVEDPAAVGGGGSVTLGEGARLNVNLHAERVAGGGGSIVLEDGARLMINAHGGQLAGGGSLVVGEGATVKVNLHAESVKAAPLPTATVVTAKVEARAKVEHRQEAKVTEEADQKQSVREDHAKTVDAAKKAKAEALAGLVRPGAEQARAPEKADDPKPTENIDPRWRMYRDVIEATDRGRHLGNGHGVGKIDMRAVKGEG
jgi:hypothetical protein